MRKYSSAVLSNLIGRKTVSLAQAIPHYHVVTEKRLKYQNIDRHVSCENTFPKNQKSETKTV